MTRKLIKGNIQGPHSLKLGFQGPRMNLSWGRKFIFYPLGIVLLWILFWGSPGWAETAAPSDVSGPGMESETKERGGLEKVWFAHRELLEKGDWEESQGEMEKIYQWKLDQGIRNHYSYSLALVRESQQGVEKGKYREAAELLNYAEKMAPDFSEVSTSRAGWMGSQISNSWENATKAVLTWFQGVWRSFSNQEEALPQIANLSLWILLSFLLTFVAFALSLFIRYYSFFAHHLKHLIRLEMNPIPLSVLSLLILFSPFLLGMGWMWTMTLWVLVFWMYAGRPERLVIIALLLLLLLLPAGIRFYSSAFFSLTGNGVPEILQANTGVWNGELYQKILAMNQMNPQDRDVLQAIGLMEKRMGKFSEAESRFLEMAKLDPRSGTAFNNLGNIYLVNSQLDQAMEAYRNAVRLEPSRGEAYYNLGQAYLLKLRMKEAEVEFQKAKSLQPQLISYYTSISSWNPNRLVIDRTIDPFQVWRRILTPTPERDQIARGLWGILWGGIPLEYGEIALGCLLAFLGGIYLVSQRLSVIRNCERCGKLICSQCTRSRVMGTQCVQCLNVFTANRSADPKVIRKKRAEAARYHSWLTSFPQRISLIVPGFGHLIRGNSKEGILHLFLFMLFVSRVFLWVDGLPNPMVLNHTLSFPWLVITGVLFLLFYSFVQYRMKQIRSQGGKFHFRTA